MRADGSLCLRVKINVGFLPESSEHPFYALIDQWSRLYLQNLGVHQLNIV